MSSRALGNGSVFLLFSDILCQFIKKRLVGLVENNLAAASVLKVRYFKLYLRIQYRGYGKKCPLIKR